MIKRSEADDLISKWVSDRTRLRVDCRTSEVNLSLEGLLESAGKGIVCVRLRNAGFIEIHLHASWKFEYFDPNSAHIPPSGRLGQNHAGEIQKTAAGLIGVSKTDKLLLLEIIDIEPLLG